VAISRDLLAHILLMIAELRPPPLAISPRYRATSFGYFGSPPSDAKGGLGTELKNRAKCEGSPRTNEPSGSGLSDRRRRQSVLS
jgi:hypothetical protein